jgi:hypothetical protein
MHDEAQHEPSKKKSNKAIFITLIIIAAVIIGGFIFMSIMASNFKAGDDSGHPFKNLHGGM